MRFRLVLGAVGPLLLCVASASQAQDFDPRGRHRLQPTAHPAVVDESHPKPLSGTGDAPSQALLIARYTRVVLAQPGAPFPLQRLSQLYRARDGNIDQLVADFELRAAQPGMNQYAATVSLGGLYKLDGRSQEAAAAYEKATVIKENDATAFLALARLHQDGGDLASARIRYEQALSLQTARGDKEQALRTLMAIALDQKDWESAKKFHSGIVTLDPNSLFVKGELGRELFQRGEYDRAVVELKEVVVAAAGDNRALAPALRELGRAQAKAHNRVEALATLKRALDAAGAQSALRAQIYEVVAEIYRADQELPALILQLAAEHPNDFPRLALLGGLYEETGDSARAIDTYRRALGIDAHQLDVRLRMIRLLQANGELDKAIAEYDGLIRSTPNNPQFVFEECEALLQRGDHPRALKLVSDLEVRAAGDEEALARVADFYARIGESDKSLKVLQRLAQMASGDPGHLVDLGDRYFQDGNVPLAVQTWKRILVAVRPRAKALSAMGDVYLDHDMAPEALVEFKEAVQLDSTNLALKKALAAAYERTRAYREARVLYEDIVAKAKEKGDKALARECRARIVTLWGLERILEQQLPGLTRQFGASPPDVEAGRMLAEAQLHLRRLPDAETTMRRVIELGPGDDESYLALERVLVQESKLGEAIAVLERLAQVEPKRARELYERMAQYALQVYKDADAIKYAARAVELNPEDAEGHRRLGAMYRSKQDVEHAILQFRAAIAKNDRLFPVYFELADLLLSKGATDEADRLFRRVVRGAVDEDLVARAARLSMQINLGGGTLETLEQDLLPLAIGNPQRSIYRRLLVEIYGSLTFGLVQRVRHGTTQDAGVARAALARVGARAVKPLLDALADQDVGQQRIAIEVLAYVQNRNAALPLFAYATGTAELSMRTRAMMACGALGDASLIGKYEALLYPRDPAADGAGLADSVALAAVWSVARVPYGRGLPLLRHVARTGTPAMRALAAVGLGMANDKASIPEVAAIAGSVDAGNVARAGAAYALGDLNALGQVPMLLKIAEEGEPLPRRMALVSLARIATAPVDGVPPGRGLAGSPPAWREHAVQAMADAAFPGEGDGPRARSESESVARTAVAALAALAGADADRARVIIGREAIPAPEGTLDVEALLDQLATRHLSDKEREAAFLSFADPILRAALVALRTSGDRARSVLDALATGQGELGSFVGRGASGPTADKARAFFTALEPSIVPLARHPDPILRAKAIVLIARSASEAAVGAVADALEDASESIRRIALAAIAGARTDGTRVEVSRRTAGAVEKILTAHENWAMRILAARAMGRLGAGGLGSEAVGPLVRAATGDSYALVRQAALESLASFDGAAARSLAGILVAGDAEPRVRDTARAIARGAGLQD